MFDYTDWGNAAEWVSAIGTGGAAIVAAGYYVLSARSRKRNQARQVHAAVNFPEEGKILPFNFVLSNDSEHAISGFYDGRCKERRLIPTLLNAPVPFQKMRDDGEVEDIPKIANLLLTPKSVLVGFDGRRKSDMRLGIETPTTITPANGPTDATKAESMTVLPTGRVVLKPGHRGMRVRTEAEWRVLPAGESVTLSPGADDRFRWSTVYWIGFLDANGNRWEREVTNKYLTYGRLRKGKRGYEIRTKRRLRTRLKHYWDVTRWVWRNRGLQTYSQWERENVPGMPQT
jgi:hypothetical protein